MGKVGNNVLDGSDKLNEGVGVEGISIVTDGTTDLIVNKDFVLIGNYIISDSEGVEKGGE